MLSDISVVLLPFVTEALHDLGLWAAAPAVLALIAWEIRRKLIAKDAELTELRKAIQELQEKRLQDAREMIRVAEAGTEATASRTQSDERVADLIETLLHRNSRSNFMGWRR